ncbi:MAG: hypothetical protein ACK53Y_02250, partial [bacterium]
IKTVDFIVNTRPLVIPLLSFAYKTAYEKLLPNNAYIYVTHHSLGSAFPVKRHLSIANSSLCRRIYPYPLVHISHWT